MRCLYCRKQIGTLRRLVDREFCSSEHRKRFHTSSARALRDAGEVIGEYDDYLAVLQQPKKTKAGAKFGIFTAASIGLIIGLSFWIVPSSPAPSPAAELRYTVSTNPIGQKLRSYITETSRINLKHDFSRGVGEWVGTAKPLANGGSLQTGGLRLWKPTLSLSDYQFDFQTSIQKKAVGWAYRAGDTQNYYGTKLALGGRAGGRSEIERFIVQGGHELERVRLPIPISISPDTMYRVRMRVKGDSFVTLVDGQVIDSWRDRRFRYGGVGFFSDKGEQASVRWVSLSEPGGFFSRLFTGVILNPLQMIALSAPPDSALATVASGHVMALMVPIPVIE
jgi:hypothetical protein